MKVEHRADEVTFFEDRARIERVCTVSLPAGAHVLELEGVSAATVDRSIVARSATAVVGDASLTRVWRIGAGERTAESQAILGEFEKLRNESEEIGLEEETVASERMRQKELVRLTLEGVNREMPYAVTFPAASRDALVSAWASLRGLARADRELRAKRMEVAERYEALRLRARQLAQPTAELATTLRIALHVEKDGQHEVRIAYTVPCALWRPMHRASLTGDTLSFECAAALWQATGETWTDIRVRCSTARSTQRAEPPVLADDWLATQERRTKEVLATFHEQALQTTGAGVASDDVPGVDDGGESRLLEATSRVSIASNGRMQRVPLFSFESPCQLDRVCRPEISPNVFFRAEATNMAKQPLLAGPVELLRDGGNVGLATLLFIAPGEKMILSFGADDTVRVYRHASETRETAKLSGKLTIRRELQLFLSHMDAGSVSFTLEERIPVSELKDVEVQIDKKESIGNPVANAEGILSYPVTLGGNGTNNFKLVYTIQAGSSVRGL